MPATYRFGEASVMPSQGNPIGHHLMLDMWNCQCSDEKLERVEFGIELMNKLGTFFTPLGLQSHQFEPFGWSAVMMLAESHIAGHVWKECNRYAAFCFFTCGGNIPEEAVATVFDFLKPSDYRRVDSPRGPLVVESAVTTVSR